MKKEVRRLIAELREQGWRLERRKSKTIAFSPDGLVWVPLHHTPSDSRAMVNVVSQLRRGGYQPTGGPRRERGGREKKPRGAVGWGASGRCGR